MQEKNLSGRKKKVGWIKNSFFEWKNTFYLAEKKVYYID